MSHKIAMLGTGLIGRFYTMSLLKYRGEEQVVTVYSRRAEQAEKFAAEFGIPRWTTDMAEAIRDPEVDTVVIGLPNYLHKPAALLAAEAGKAVLCTKPLATNAEEALEMLRAVEEQGFFTDTLKIWFIPQRLSRRWSLRAMARWERCCGHARAKPMAARTVTGFGPKSSLAEAPL